MPEKAQEADQNKSQIKILRWENTSPITQEEAEAFLHKEGYESFCWYDVPGAEYPRHRHEIDECLWILRGEIHFTIEGKTHILQSGDRIYLPAKTPHRSHVPKSNGVTYLVGHRKKSNHSISECVGEL